MLEDGSNRQTFAVDRHAGVVGSGSSSTDSSPKATAPDFQTYLQATAGLSADGRQAVNRARAEASNYKK